MFFDDSKDVDRSSSYHDRKNGSRIWTSRCEGVDKVLFLFKLSPWLSSMRMEGYPGIAEGEVRV